MLNTSRRRQMNSQNHSEEKEEPPIKSEKYTTQNINKSKKIIPKIIEHFQTIPSEKKEETTQMITAIIDESTNKQNVKDNIIRLIKSVDISRTNLNPEKVQKIFEELMNDKDKIKIRIEELIKRIILKNNLNS